MAAYAALVSAARALDECSDDINDIPCGIDHEKEEEIDVFFKSLLQSFTSLEAFLDDFQEEAENLEGRIRDVAQEAEDLIEDFMLKLRQQREGSDKEDKLCTHFDDLSGELQKKMQVKKINSDYSSSKVGCTSYMHHISRYIQMNAWSKRRSSKPNNVAPAESSHFRDLSLGLQKVNQVVHSIEEEVVKIKNISNTTGGGGVRDLQSISTTTAIAATDVYSSSPSAESSFSSSSKLQPPTRTTSTSRDDVVMVGFDDQLMAIKERLCGYSRKLQVIPISGMGGIGKTTLARNAFDDRLIKEEFHLHAWATVSQTYSVREIFLSILVSCNVLKDKASGTNESVEWLKERTYKSLKGRRYVIVVDDVWSTEAWDEMRRVFPDDNNGSRVLLTTRLSQVAEYAAAGVDSDLLIHYMEFLDADQSWKLLQEKVFSSSSTEGRQSCSCPPELEDIGMDIARRCGGLPLTIVVVAGILRNVSRATAAWEVISHKVNAVTVAESSRDERVSNVLSLSYRHLPHHLRPCFLYMAAFPKDYEIYVSDLSRIWIAEGFFKRQRPINTSSINKRFEETRAYENLENLVQRSLILVTERDIGGKIVRCSLHDLLRDMCIKKARDEKFLQRVDHHHQYSSTISGGPLRRLSIDYMNDNLYNNIISTNHPSMIRTILSFQKPNYATSESDAYYHSLFCVPATRLLKVFHAPEIIFKQFPSAVLHLFHLRYLTFRYFYKQQTSNLLADVYNLKKLQTLVVRYDHQEFPFNIWKMSHLRHLQVGNLHLWHYIAKSITFTTLENLQTLSEVFNLVCTETIMKSMPNLKLLKLYYDDKEGIKDLSEFQIENLVHLHQLEILHLDMSPYAINGLASLPEKLALPTTVRELTLSNCMIAWEKLGLIGSSLPNLQVLTLNANACCGKVWETEEGQFSQLKVLDLNSLSLQQWITESGDHFPILDRLLLYDCTNLLEIPDGIGEIPTLQLIKVSYCNKSLVESAEGIKCNQNDMGNDDLRLQIYHY